METPRLLGKCYSVRVTLSLFTLPAQFVQSLLSKCHAVVACEHAEEGKRTHLHFAIVNSVLTHDPLRKFIVSLLKDVTNLEGNSLLSVKKWDLRDRYLVYCIKGENPFIINTDGTPDVDYIPNEEWLRLKGLWVSQTVQENDYSAWKASRFFPKSTIAHVYKGGITAVPLQYKISEYQPTVELQQIQFADVRKAALDYALDVYGGFVTAKVRYLAKDLISNYCMFNNIKMAPVYI